MRAVLNSLWELFFPRCCVVCGRRIHQGEQFLCLHCLLSLPRTHYHTSAENEVEKDFWGKLPIQRASAFLYYAKGSIVRKLLYELKYYGNKEIGEALGAVMATEMRSSGFFDGIDYIIPVPLHPKKQRQRGYNQSECIAKGIAAVTHLPILTNRLLRSHYTNTQTHKSSYERWQNMSGMFTCPQIDGLSGKHVLLVDDVLTTGATLVACGDALRAVKDIQISVLTLAVAKNA